MKTPTRQTAVRLIHRFGAKARQISFVQNGVFRVVLDTGKVYSLKRMPCTVRRLRWIDRTLRRMKQTGYAGIAWGSHFAKKGSRLFAKVKPSALPYVLAPWIHGRWPNPRNHNDMRVCGIALARFHQTAVRIRPSLIGTDNKIGSWPAKLRTDQGTIAEFVTIARGNGFGRPMDGLLRQYGDEIIGYCRQSQQMLRESSYRLMCRKQRNLRPLCHGDGGPTNFILNKNGTHLIDFETLRLDLRAYDLYRFIYNACKDHHWNFSIARSFLDGYQTVSKLNKGDITLVKTWLRFPRTVQLLLREFKISSPLVKTKTEKEFPRAVRVERKMGSFLHQLETYISS